MNVIPPNLCESLFDLGFSITHAPSECSDNVVVWLLEREDVQGRLVWSALRERFQVSNNLPFSICSKGTLVVDP